jgi:hypothetical protein
MLTVSFGDGLHPMVEWYSASSGRNAESDQLDLALTER